MNTEEDALDELVEAALESPEGREQLLGAAIKELKENTPTPIRQLERLRKIHESCAKHGLDALGLKNLLERAVVYTVPDPSLVVPDELFPEFS